MASFFEKLTGSHNDGTNKEVEEIKSRAVEKDFMDEVEEENEEGQLAIDVFQTATDIIIQAIAPGIKPEDLDVSLTHEMITIRGQRENKRRVDDENFFYREVYWGAFSRSLLLPQEVDPDGAEAEIKNGVLTIKLPKLDKERIQKLKVKS